MVSRGAKEQNQAGALVVDLFADLRHRDVRFGGDRAPAANLEGRVGIYGLHGVGLG